MWNTNSIITSKRWKSKVTSFPYEKISMKKVIIIINPTSGGETALDYKESLESKVKEYFDYVETKITQKAKDATHFAQNASE